MLLLDKLDQLVLTLLFVLVPQGTLSDMVAGLFLGGLIKMVLIVKSVLLETSF